MLDAQLVFAEDLDCTVAAGSTVESTNVVYIPQFTDAKGNSANDRPNMSGKLVLNVMVTDTDFKSNTGTTSPVFRLFADSDATDVAQDGDQVLEKTITIDTAGANYPVGTKIMSVPLPMDQFKPYLELQCEAPSGGNNVAQGKITAWIGWGTNETD